MNNSEERTINKRTINKNNNIESDIPDWFYFAFGMMLVFFSGLESEKESPIINNSQPVEIATSEKDGGYTNKIATSLEVEIINLEPLSEIPLEQENFSNALIFNFSENEFSDHSGDLLPN